MVGETVPSIPREDKQAKSLPAANWRETQDGWAVSPFDGATANIQVTRKGVRWNLMLTGSVETIAEAQNEIEYLVSKISAGEDMD